MKIFDEVRELLAALNGAESVTLASRLREDISLDSLNMVMLLLAIEEKYDIVLDEADMNPFDLITVEDVVKLVEKYRGENNEEVC